LSNEMRIEGMGRPESSNEHRP